jgi:mannose-6-phosphate isomerase-like protein (cupin superfamily)
MSKAIIIPDAKRRPANQPPISATGRSFDVHEWNGSGPGYLHIHYSDDEAWHVLEGTLTFRFSDKEVEAPAGTTVFVPAGVAHDYYEAEGPTRYLIILTPRLRELITELAIAPREQHDEIMYRFDSEILG